MEETGMKRLLASLLHDIGLRYTPMKSYEDKKKALDIMHPQEAQAGFTEIAVVIPCECGTMITLAAEPGTRSRAEADEMAEKAMKEHEAVIVRGAIGDEPESEEDMVQVAMNIGFAPSVCRDCGRKYLSAWKVECIQINRAVDFPWDGPEGPEHPASGSFRKETIH